MLYACGLRKFLPSRCVRSVTVYATMCMISHRSCLHGPPTNRQARKYGVVFLGYVSGAGDGGNCCRRPVLQSRVSSKQSKFSTVPNAFEGRGFMIRQLARVAQRKAFISYGIEILALLRALTGTQA